MSENVGGMIHTVDGQKFGASPAPNITVQNIKYRQLRDLIGTQQKLFQWKTALQTAIDAAWALINLLNYGLQTAKIGTSR